MKFFYIPHSTKTRIRVELSEGCWEAVFDWNDGELDSKMDYQIPTVGYGNTTQEAIGNLVVNYDRSKRSDV